MGSRLLEYFDAPVVWECPESPDGKHAVDPWSVQVSPDCKDSEQAILAIRCKHCGLTGTVEVLFNGMTVQWVPKP